MYFNYFPTFFFLDFAVSVFYTHILITRKKNQQGCHWSGKFKVREKSGNFRISQGNLEFCWKSGKFIKSQGNFQNINVSWEVSVINKQIQKIWARVFSSRIKFFNTLHSNFAIFTTICCLKHNRHAHIDY